ncbi:MAG: metallophosphoesterase [Pseudomonadota bacterium]
MSWFRRILQNKGREFTAPLMPDSPFWVVSDLHGCKDLLEKALAYIPKEERKVFVGDYIDRGPDSAGVLKRLVDLQTKTPKTTICLKGNHEAMLLKFIGTDGQSGRRWLKFGGLETCQSFGVRNLETHPSLHTYEKIAKDLKSKMGLDLLAWIQDLPSIWSNGNIHVTHAGADPSVPMSLQSDESLLWGAEFFENRNRRDQQWVIRGHKIVPKLTCKEGKISIDLGSYKTSIIGLANIKHNSCYFKEISSR